MFANTVRVVDCKEKSLKEGMKNPFGQCAPLVGAVLLPEGTMPTGRTRSRP
jgi:hypothetical protein